MELERNEAARTHGTHMELPFRTTDRPLLDNNRGIRTAVDF